MNIFETLSLKRGLLWSYGSLFILAAAVGLLSVAASIYNAKNVKNILQNYHHQETIISHMHSSARERVVTLYKIVLEEDPFIRDELFTIFNERGTEFIISRNRVLDQIGEGPLRELVLEQDKVTQPLGLLNRQIADLALDDQLQEAQQLMMTEAVQLQNETFSFYARMDKALSWLESEAIGQAEQYRRYSEILILISVVIILAIVFVIGYRSIRHEIDSDKALLLEKRRSDVTLKSMPDGIVICDLDNGITDMNPVAENILGRSLYNCQNRYLPDILAEISDKVLLDGICEIREKTHTLPIKLGLNVFREIELTVTPVVVAGKEVGKVVVLHDISMKAQAERQLRHLASHDALTGLFNRRQFEEDLTQCLRDSNDSDLVSNWLCYIDVDDFKGINDEFGHGMGDEVLKNVSDRIKSCLRTGDNVYRIGGDEFVVIIAGCARENALSTADRLLNALISKPVNYDGKQVAISASIGVIQMTGEDRSLDDMIVRADEAMYSAKHEGKSMVVFVEGSHTTGFNSTAIRAN